MEQSSMLPGLIQEELAPLRREIREIKSTINELRVEAAFMKSEIKSIEMQISGYADLLKYYQVGFEDASQLQSSNSSKHSLEEHKIDLLNDRLLELEAIISKTQRWAHS